jgi:putative PIN family toxin of toxin-antitoxin system
VGQEQIRRVVIDTNVFISAVLFGGRVDGIRQLWQRKKIVYLISGDVLKEYIKVLAYPKFNLTEEEIHYIIDEELLPYVTPVEVKSNIKYIKEDHDDDKFLSLAVDGHADYIISGDKHLLDVKEFQNTKIITVREFLEI